MQIENVACAMGKVTEEPYNVYRNWKLSTSSGALRIVVEK